MGKKPRQLSLIKFDFTDLPKEYHDQYPFHGGETFLYLGEIPNMPGHCVVIDIKTQTVHTGYHIENFRELNEEET